MPPTAFQVKSVLRHGRRAKHFGLDSQSRPPIISHITRASHALEERMVPTPGSPRPPGTTLKRWTIQSKRDPSERHAHYRPENDIEAMVPIIEPARSRDKECHCPRHKRKDYQIDGRRGALITGRKAVPRAQVLCQRCMREVGKFDREFGAQPK